MVEGRDLHSGFRIQACAGTEQEVLESISKLRERHRQPSKDFTVHKSNQTGGVYPARFSKRLGWQKGANHALPRRALLACPPVQATASERLLCSVNHLDNMNSCSALFNYFLLMSAPFHWYIQSTISTARLSLLNFAAAAQHAEQ